MQRVSPLTLVVLNDGGDWRWLDNWPCLWALSRSSGGLLGNGDDNVFWASAVVWCCSAYRYVISNKQEVAPLESSFRVFIIYVRKTFFKLPSIWLSQFLLVLKKTRWVGWGVGGSKSPPTSSYPAVTECQLQRQRRKETEMEIEGAFVLRWYSVLRGRWESRDFFCLCSSFAEWPLWAPDCRTHTRTHSVLYRFRQFSC